MSPYYALSAGNLRALKAAARAEGISLHALMTSILGHYVADGKPTFSFVPSDLKGHQDTPLLAVDRPALRGLSLREVASRMPPELVNALQRAGVPCEVVAPWFAQHYTPERGAALLDKMDDALWVTVQGCGGPRRRLKKADGLT